MSEQNDVVDRDEVTGRAVGDQLEQRLDLGADDRNSGSRRMARRLTPDRVAIGHADKRGRCVRMFDRPVAGRSERERDSGSGSAPLAPRDVPLLRSTFAEHSNRGWLRFVAELRQRFDDQVETAGGSERPGEEDDVAVCGFRRGVVRREVQGRSEERRLRGVA